MLSPYGMEIVENGLTCKLRVDLVFCWFRFRSFLASRGPSQCQNYLL